jgi:hypothetical protein
MVRAFPQVSWGLTSSPAKLERSSTMFKTLLCGTVAAVAIGGVGAQTAEAGHGVAVYGGVHGGHYHRPIGVHPGFPRYPGFPWHPGYPVYPGYPRYYAPQPVVVPVYPQPLPCPYGYPAYAPGVGFSNRNFSLWLGR